MSLKGNLQSVDLANVLQMLSINQKEGTLVLFDGDIRKSIYFSREGVSLLARDRRANDSLGRILLRYGKLDADQLQAALAQHASQNRRLGDVLRETGFCSPEDVDQAVRTQIEEEIYDLFIWKEASFEFHEGPPTETVEDPTTQVTFNVNSLIMEAQRRADEWNWIQGLVPSLDEVYRPNEGFDNANLEDEVFQLPFASRVLELAREGSHNVRDIIARSYGGKFEVCKMMAQLLEQGAIEPVSMADLQSMANEASGRGDHAHAAKFLERIVDLGGATPHVNLQLGYALEALGEAERASIYLKAAAESYIESLDPQPAFDALQRVARVLPTDLPAVTQFVDTACGQPEILAANRHEVVETGRKLAACLKIVGRGSHALQVLHKLSKANPGNLALRNQLVSSYLESGMNDDAMRELESMSDICAAEKNYEEAIRYLRKVLSLDRNRSGALKKVETLQKARDRTKNLILRGIGVAVLLGALGAAWWGWMRFQENTRLARERANTAVETALEPLESAFDAAEDQARAAAEPLGRWRDLSLDEIRTAFAAVEAAVAEVGDCMSAIEATTTTLFKEHGENLSPTFTTDPRVRGRRETLAEVADLLRKFKVDVFENALTSESDVEALIGKQGRLYEARERLRRIVGLLELIEAEGEEFENARTALESLDSNIGTAEQVQELADEAWADERYTDARDRIVEFLAAVGNPLDFAERLRLRLHLVTTPVDTEIEILAGLVDDGPAVRTVGEDGLDIPYSAAGGLSLEVRRKGFRTATFRIDGEASHIVEAEELKRRMLADTTIVLDKVPVWTVDCGAAGIEAEPTPTPDGSRIVLADRGGAIHVIETQTGAPAPVKIGTELRFLGGFTASPVIEGDRVFVASVDGQLMAFSLETLEVLWAVPAEGGPGPVRATPVVVDGLLIVASDEGTLTAWDSATGTQRWTNRVGGGVRQDLRFVDDPERRWVVVQAETGWLFAVAPDGSEVIPIDPKGENRSRYTPPPAAPVVVRNKILFGLSGSGEPFRLTDLPLPGGIHQLRWSVGIEKAAPVGATWVPNGDRGQLLLLFDDGAVRRVDPDRIPRAADPTHPAIEGKKPPHGVPAWGSGTLFVTTRAHLVALEPQTLGYTPRWRWAVGEETEIATNPVVTGSLVLVGTRDGRLHALLQD